MSGEGGVADFGVVKGPAGGEEGGGEEGEAEGAAGGEEGEEKEALCFGGCATGVCRPCWPCWLRPRLRGALEDTSSALELLKRPPPLPPLLLRMRRYMATSSPPLPPIPPMPPLPLPAPLRLLS